MKSYEDMADESIALIQAGGVPHIGIVEYLLHFSDSSRPSGESVMRAIDERCKNDPSYSNLVAMAISEHFAGLPEA